MKRHLFGAILFCVIFGTAIFDKYCYLPVPEPLPETLTSIFDKEKSSQIEFNKKYLKSRALEVTFYSKSHSISARIEGPAGRFKTAFLLHFFEQKNNSTELLFSINSSPGARHNHCFYTGKEKVEALAQMKSLQNIYVIAEGDPDYEQHPIPVFVSEFAVPITVEKNRKY